MSSSTTTASVTQPKYLTLTFNNTALKELLMDEEEKNFTRQVSSATDLKRKTRETVTVGRLSTVFLVFPVFF